jgi:hypothetical protein
MADTGDLKLTTYSVVGNREGLTDTIADLFADETPLFSMARKTKATSVLHEWQEDSLAAASKTGIVEGAVVNYVQPGQRTRLKNPTQIRLRNWDVTFTQTAVSKAGIKSDVARELMKAMKALATDYELIFQSTADTSDGTTAVGRTARGLSKAITNNVVSNAGVSTFLQEANVGRVLQLIYDDGGDPRVLFCGSQSKRQISETFSAKTGFSFNINQSARTMISNINRYEGSFGTLDIMPDRQIRPEKVHIVSPDMIRVAVLRDIAQYRGAQTASSIKGWVEGEMTLEWGNQKAHGKISGVKTSGTVS